MMYKQKMIENEKDFDCQMKHQQPISMVILDPQLKSNQRLLCQKCIDDFETQTRTMGLKRAIQMIEDNRKLQMEFLGNLITQNIKNIELFQSKLFDLQSYLVQQLDQMIDITKDWIQNLQSACQKFSEYSFFEELDSIIMNNKSSQIDQNNFSNQIKLLNEAWNIKLNSKLELFKSFQEYQQFKDILNYLSQQFQDLQCVQSNVVIQQSVNQNQEQNNQFSNSTILQQQNQQSPMKLQLIDNTIEQKDQCHAITFDPTGKIMVSTSGKKIIIWSFDYGMLKQTHIFQEHQDSVSCLIYSQFNNYFISGSLDKSIRMWKYQNNNQWQSSKPYYEHKESITCTILTQQEDQLISSSGDNLIKVWMVDFNNNQLQFQYSLDKHTSKVYSLSLNPSGILLVSCGDNSQIIIWKKKSNKQWNFYYVVIVIENVQFQLKQISISLFLFLLLLVFYINVNCVG